MRFSGAAIACAQDRRRCIAPPATAEFQAACAKARRPASVGVGRVGGDRRRRVPRPRATDCADRLAERRLQRAARLVDGVGIDVAADRLGDVGLARQRQRERAEGRIELVVVGKAAEAPRRSADRSAAPRRARIAAVARSSMASAICCAASQRLNGSGSWPIRNRRSSGREIRLHVDGRRELAEQRGDRRAP